MKFVKYTLLLLALGAGAAYGQNEDIDVPQSHPLVPQVVETARDAWDLFVPAGAPAGAAMHRQAVSAVTASPNLDMLKMSAPGDRIKLAVAAGTDLVMLVTRFERHSETSYSVGGVLREVDGGTVLMAVEGDALACDIRSATEQLHYKTKYAGEGVHFVCRMDDDKYAPCGNVGPLNGVGPNDPDWAPEAGEMDGIDAEALGGGYTPRGTCSDVQVVFDAMIVYTDLARAAAGGTSAIQAECQLAVDASNDSYQNSGVNARKRLVRRYELAYDEVGTYYDHLDRLTGTNGLGGGAPWTTTRTNRDTYNADFCSLFVDDGDFCGLAWCTAAANRAYSIVTWSCAAGNLSYPHEVGHNQGCDHDPDNITAGCAAYSYSYGHRFFGTNGVQYRTVMAYAPGDRIPYFSNINVNYQGTATGTATRANEDTIENRKAVCEDFEFTRWDIWLDDAFAGVEIGTYANPYNTVAEGVAQIDDWVVGASEYPNLYMKQGVYDVAVDYTITKEMTISPCGGAVTIQ